jgi:hypothetical protein
MFREALHLVPDLADAWVNLELVRYRCSDIEGAKAAMRRAMATVPRPPRRRQSRRFPYA